MITLRQAWHHGHQDGYHWNRDFCPHYNDPDPRVRAAWSAGYALGAAEWWHEVRMAERAARLLSGGF